jgi:hypothetical protein
MGCNGKSKNTQQESGHANASDCRCSCFPAHGADTCFEPISEDDRPRAKRCRARDTSCAISQDARSDRYRRHQQTQKRAPGPRGTIRLHAGPRSGLEIEFDLCVVGIAKEICQRVPWGSCSRGRVVKPGLICINTQQAKRTDVCPQRMPPCANDGGDHERSVRRT